MSPVRWGPVRWGRLPALLAAMALAGPAAACAPADDDEGELVLGAPESEALSSEEMGALGARIYLDPERAEEIAAEAGMTPEAFEARVRAITRDPGESEAYARAFDEGVAGGAPAGGEEPGGS